MAGNTKFMGFSPDGMVKLTRWGGEAMIEISKESVASLRIACFDGLPKKPPLHTVVSKPLRINYDETTGAVVMVLDPFDAEKIMSVLVGADAEGEQIYKTATIEVAKAASEKIKDAVQAHHDFINTDGEPGVESERTN